MRRIYQYATTKPLLTLGWVFVTLYVLAQYLRIFQRPYGDFPNHWEWGRRFVSGEFLYTNGLNIPYPPFWGMAHAPLSIIPVHTAQILVYPVSLLAAVLLFWALHRLTVKALPYQREQLGAIVLLSLLLSVRYWPRDLVECLPNLTLVALSWLAVYLWSRSREWLGGISLGLAAALKLTPLLFVPYFALKRQWKMVCVSLLFTGVFSAAPILYLGSGSYIQHLQTWSNAVFSGVTQQDPTYGVLGESQYKNMSLRSTLARYLITLPPGHKSRIDHPAYPDFLNLPPKVANWLILMLMGALFAFVVWRFGGKVDTRADTRTLWECATVSLLIVLYSPITWGQSCVGVIPACYLIARQWVQHEKFPVWIKTAVWVFIVLTIVLNPRILGADLAPVVESLRIETMGILALLAAVLGFHARSQPRETGKD